MAAIQDTGSDRHAQRSPRAQDTTPQITKNQAQDLQSLDVPLHMSAQIHSNLWANFKVSVPQSLRRPKRGRETPATGKPIGSLAAEAKGLT